MKKLIGAAGVAMLALSMTACNSSKSSGSAAAPTAATAAGATTQAGATQAAATDSAAALPSGAVIGNQSKYHAGDAQTVRINDDKVKVTLAKLTDPATGAVEVVTATPDATVRNVGVQMTFDNISSSPEAIGLAAPSGNVSDTEFDVTGQFSGGGDDESFNNYATGFSGCTPTAASNTLAPGATAVYCVILSVPTNKKIVEIDWNGEDTDNDMAIWLVP
jgi:hypothetical protein